MEQWSIADDFGLVRFKHSVFRDWYERKHDFLGNVFDNAMSIKAMVDSQTNLPQNWFNSILLWFQHYLHLLNIRHPLISFDILMIWSCGRFCCELSVIVLAWQMQYNPQIMDLKDKINEDLRPVWNGMVWRFFWVSVGLTVYPSYIHTSSGNCTRSKLELCRFWTSHSPLPTTWQTSQFRPVSGKISTRLYNAIYKNPRIPYIMNRI